MKPPKKLKRRKGRASSTAKADLVEESKDEIDEFQEQKELVMLDQIDVASSSDEQSEFDEEVLELELSSDEEEVLTREPSRAWGQTKSSFYSGEDQEDLSSNEGAEFEEKEAVELQTMLATTLNESDFEPPVAMETEQVDDGIAQSELKTSIPQDLSTLSAEEIRELLGRKCPELFELLENFEDTLNHVLSTLLPDAVVARQQHDELNEKESKFLEANLHLHLCYCVNIMFYLLMKSSQTETNSHPVIGSLYKIRQMMSYMSVVEQQMNSLKMNHVDKTSSVKASDNIKAPINVASEEVDPLNYYEQVKMRKQFLKKSNVAADLTVPSPPAGCHDDKDDKRAITFQIARNKGLIPKRRKEQRNPRVKHRKKFQKAIIKRKSQVLPVTTELYKYGGEASGIRSHLTRSVKIM